MSDLYQVLGVSRDASLAVIKKAYKTLAQKNHPDKGGDPETFQAIQRAWDVLGNTEKRTRYDATGDDTHVREDDEGDRMALASMFLSVLDGMQDVDHFSLVTEVENQIKRIRGELEASLVATGRLIARRETALRRLQHASGSTDEFVMNVLRGDIATKQRNKEHSEKELARVSRLLETLEGYSYNTDPQTSYTTYVIGGSRMGTSTTTML